MRVNQLETDLRARKAKVKDLAERTYRACQEHVVKAATATEPAITGRLMTDEERAAIKALQDECLDIEGRINRARGDDDMMAAINAMTGSLEITHRPRRSSGGQQFVHDAQVKAFFAAQGHRRAQWTSPQVVIEHWADFHAATLTEDAASGGSMVQPQYLPSVLPLPMRRPVVGDLPAPGSTTSNLISYTKETTFTNAADVVKEALAKPESTLIFAPATAPVRKIAHWIPVSEELLEDAPATASIIDGRLRWGIEIKEEDELLNGSGVDPHLLGYNTLPGLAPPVVQGTEPVADAILQQMTNIAVNALVMPDGFVLNPADWFGIQIMKNSMGNYLGSGPWAAPQAPMLWGVSGVVTPAQVALTALVGGFRSSSQIFRRSGITVEASNSHADFFVKNLVAIRAEERLALAVYREAAFGKVTLAAGSP